MSKNVQLNNYYRDQFKVVKHISAMHHLPALAETSLTPGSKQSEMFKKMSKAKKRSM